MEKFYSDDMTKEEMESIAFNKTFKDGMCKKTVFAGGGHRTGLVPIYRINDGGLPGVICQRICLECRKKFKFTGFLPCKEPKEPEVS